MLDIYISEVRRGGRGLSCGAACSMRLRRTGQSACQRLMYGVSKFNILLYSGGVASAKSDQAHRT